MNEALEYIKSMYNGEIPYRYGRDECAKLMAEYAEYYHKQKVKKLNTPDVSVTLRQCSNCANLEKGNACDSCDSKLSNWVRNER